MNRRILVAAAALAVAVLAATAGGAGAAGTAGWTVTKVATGLDSPRGLVFAPDGTLYVAESGHGGDVCTAGNALCVGLTSRISKVDTKTGARTPVVTGLYSRSVPMEGITGVDGLAAQGGKLFGAITLYPQELEGLGCGGQPADCAQVLAGARAQAGQLIQFTPGGTVEELAGVGANDFEWAGANPSYSKEPANANPYGVYALPAGAYVADAGANTLDFVAANGDITVSSAIAPPAPGGFPADTVPTCVTMIHGNLYAGSLSGHLWKRGGSFTPTEVPVAGAGGTSLIHHVTGCTSDAKGDLYLVDMWASPGPPIPAGPQSTAGTGSVVELAADGTASVLASGLDFPNGIALAKDGSLYVTVGSTCTAVGTPFPDCANGGGIVRLSH